LATSLTPDFFSLPKSLCYEPRSLGEGGAEVAWPVWRQRRAGVAELVDALDLGFDGRRFRIWN
jgi:hypothetical protein